VGTAFDQEVLPNPCAHIAFGPDRSQVHGVGTRRFRAHLEGTARVFGVKFRPAGFYPFTFAPLASLVDRVVPIAAAFGEGGACADEDVRRTDDDRAAAAIVEAFLRRRGPREEPGMRAANAIVEMARENCALMRAADLAREASTSLRSLQRLLEKYVGVGAKWIVRRARVQEAADRVARGATVDWAALAQELGYHDQAHFVRDFKDQVGETPAAYAARCRPAG
jgi:AraC-like DNA-binding protein